MGFFDVQDGEGGSVQDRIAIIIIISLAFSWIPVMIIWRIITIFRRRHGRNMEDGNMPITTRSFDPRDHPQPRFTPTPVYGGEQQSERPRPRKTYSGGTNRQDFDLLEGPRPVSIGEDGYSHLPTRHPVRKAHMPATTKTGRTENKSPPGPSSGRRPSRGDLGQQPSWPVGPSSDRGRMSHHYGYRHPAQS